VNALLDSCKKGARVKVIGKEGRIKFENPTGRAGCVNRGISNARVKGALIKPS
jgi:hypothetical protein